MQKAVILLVEGKRAGQNTAVPALEKAGHTYTLCHTGNEAIKTLTNFTPHLIIFNAATMRTTGSRICRRIKRNDETLPIIHIRAAGSLKDLTAEADIYLEQPFTSRKLLNRVRDLLPIDYANEEIVRYGHITLFLSKKAVDVSGKGESRITPKLAHLLEQFLRHPCQMLTRRDLMQSVWKTDYIGDTRTLDVHIRWAREHIEENPAKPQFLKTVRGKGYILSIFRKPHPLKKQQKVENKNATISVALCVLNLLRSFVAFLAFLACFCQRRHQTAFAASGITRMDDMLAGSFV